MIFFYIRHGTPTYEPDALTPLGHRQAEAVGKRLALYGIDKIFSSTSNRAYETAVPTAEMLQKEIVQLDFANESHAWHDFSVKINENQKNWAFALPEYKALFSKSEVQSLGRSWHDHPAFAETNFSAGMERVQRETDAFFASLGYEHDHENNCFRAVAPTNERVAMFAHQGFGMVFLSCILDIPYPAMVTRFDIGHSGMTVIKFEGDDVIYPKVLQLSSDSHLYKEGIMTGYNNKLRF